MLKFHTIALSLLLAWAETAFAQKMKVNLEDGEYITYDISKVVSIQFPGAGRRCRYPTLWQALADTFQRAMAGARRFRIYNNNVDASFKL